MILNTWGEVLTTSFQSLSIGVVDFVPNLIIAIIIFIAGWVVGSLFGRVVSQIVKSLKVDNALKSAGTESILNKLEIQFIFGIILSCRPKLKL